MTDTLVTAVDNAIDRIVAMELLAVTDAGTRATKEWIQWFQAVPYWTNRPTGLTNPATNRWTLSIEARLTLAHISAATNPDASGDTPQELVWEYIPSVLRYFRQYKNLNPPALSEIQYLGTDGVSITCPAGLDVFNIPGQTFTALYVRFNITVPFLIYE